MNCVRCIHVGDIKTKNLTIKEKKITHMGEELVFGEGLLSVLYGISYSLIAFYSWER